jgi:hypothetical protein
MVFKPQKVRCNRGHTHEVYAVGQLSNPYPCTAADMLITKGEEHGIHNRKSKEVDHVLKPHVQKRHKQN